MNDPTRRPPSPEDGPDRAGVTDDGADRPVPGPREEGTTPTGGDRGPEGADPVGTSPSPEPSPEPDASYRPGRAARRALPLTLAAGALGATVVLIASGQRWAEALASGAAGGTLPVTVTGGEVSGLPSALALVGLASLVAVFAVRRTGRRIVSGVLLLAGAGAVASAVAGARDTSALHAAAAEVTGLTQAPLSGVDHTPWPWVSAIGGLALVLAGLLALRYGAVWPAMSGRYERTGPNGLRAGGRPGRGGSRRAARPADPERPEEMWKAMDRGEDPTG
ncbi:TIGR02234 family membrane protein [Streptomyces sp. ST2-7A]|uniref:TIGR02234 family membrane protein n=1 Tax=Streptomyces sp. ST2-7A TaxID=2907214 RepID=UPI001F3F5084|nr:TIGR02234 family membrane protein [Streptomyces sp. ST2-7A]MCE7083516.1 TIGR02234 family membrane protein [Streptomyces sp. ST2-7A]